MLSNAAIVLSAFVCIARSAEDLNFPPGFKFGVASSAYQVEGAWNVSDKSESIWDRFTHRSPSPIADGSTGDVACDSYHLWQEDVKIAGELGAHFYRISISWSRLLPSGFVDHISEDGAAYYNKLIDGLREKGVETIITLYHWDLPQRLQDLGGWTNPLIVDWFADYARVVFSLYGDRVKTWITINEAWVVCDVPYTLPIFAPAIVNPVAPYICTKNVLMAHAKAWRIYDEEFKPKYHGEVSLSNHLTWLEPANKTDEAATQLVREYQEGRFSHPIYSKEGGWPAKVEQAIADFSRKEGYPRSLLPTLSKEEIEFIRGTYDFYGLNFYYSRRVRRAKEGESLRPWPVGDAPLLHAKLEKFPDLPVERRVFSVYPEGIRKQMALLKQQYGDIPILITENGRETSAGLHDPERIDYYKKFLKQVLLAIKEDGVNVTGYTAWSLMDNMEWNSGYRAKFGLYEVDFSSPMRTRTARSSAKFYREVIARRSLDVPYNYTDNVARKTSKPEDNKTSIIVFGGLILVVVVGIVAGVVGCRISRKARLEKKRRYIAVRNGAQNGTQNGAENGTHNGTQSDRNGVEESKIPLTT